MAFWRQVRDWIVGILFGALLLGTLGAPAAQLFFALQTLKLVNSDHNLRLPPLGDEIWISLRFSVDGAIIGIAGAGLFWLSTLVAGPERGTARTRRQKACELGSLPLCGCVCLIATVIQLVSIRNKQKYLPLLSDDVHGTPTWPVDMHSLRSFWNVADEYYAAEMGITLRSDSKIGASARPYDDDLASFHFLVEYRVQIVATTCLFFLGLGLIGTVMLDLSDRFQRRTILSRLGYSISTWLGVICILSVAGPIFLVFEFFEKVAPWTRYQRAYAAKVCERPVSRLRPIMHRLHQGVFAAGWRIRHGHALAAGLHATRQLHHDIEMGLDASRPTAVSPIMAICKYDLAVVLGQQMHYTDVVALSQTCRAWHDCIFPKDRDLHEQQSRFKAYSCNVRNLVVPIRLECWSCTSSICCECWGHSGKIDQDLVESHLYRCVPYCRGCFRTLMKGSIRRLGCRMAKNRVEPAAVCAPCRKDSREPFTWKGSRKWKHKLRERDLTMQTCGKCTQPLEAKGARFWVCRKDGCEHECRSSAHLTWIAPGEEQGKVAAVTTEEVQEDLVGRSVEESSGMDIG